VEDVSLTNVRIESEEAGKDEWTQRLIPEVEKSYPEARMFGRLPAYGLFLRHATAIKVDNLRLTTAKGDERPAVHCDDVADLHIRPAGRRGSHDVAALVRLTMSGRR